MILYPIIGYGNVPNEHINKTKCRRLLLLAQSPNHWHKRFYHLYYHLVQEGLVRWVLGTAFLTPEGVEELNRLNKENNNAVQDL